MGSSRTIFGGQMMNLRPWIGIRGWTHADQTKNIGLAFGDLEHAPTRMFAIIVNVDDITLIEGERRARERCGEGNAHARSRPPADDIIGNKGHPGIFVNHPLILNFVSLEANEMFIWDRMEDVVERYGPLLHGIELGAMWPPVWAVQEFRERYPSLRLILRMTRDAVRALGGMDDPATPSRVGARVKEYPVTDVALNLSGPAEEGGVRFDTELVRGYLSAIRAAAPDVCLCAAGGFGAKLRTLEPFQRLITEFPDLSIAGGAAVTSVANCVDVSSAVALYRNGERIAAERAAAGVAERQFQEAKNAYNRVRQSYS
ncbi:MAG: hypothetical protein HYZ07_01030 [Candidatus Harrisonbacteria bacterium]|nr:hypothetical protein [Candidatus Harrisonbacteria bacterium]